MDIQQLKNINHSLTNSSAGGSIRLSSREEEINHNLKIVVEEIIETKLAASKQSSYVISSGHPGFASTFKL